MAVTGMGFSEIHILKKGADKNLCLYQVRVSVRTSCPEGGTPYECI